MHSGNRSMAVSFKQTSSSIIYLHMHSRTHTHTQSANSFFSLHIGKEASHCTLSSLHTLMIIGHNISSPLPICSPWMTCSSLSLPLCLKLHQQEEKSKNHLIYFSTMCKCLSQFEEWSIFSLRLLLYAFRSGCAHSHIHTKATEVWLYTSTCSTHKHICTRAGVNSYYSPLEYMTETEEVWSGNGVFCLMSSLFQTHVHTHTQRLRALKFLLFNVDLWITLFSCSDGTQHQKARSLLNSWGSAERQSLIEKERKVILQWFSALAV